MVQSFTSQSSNVRSEIALKHAGGRTALYDAVYMGLDTMRVGSNEKKALILITDGEDTAVAIRFPKFANSPRNPMCRSMRWGSKDSSDMGVR